MDDFIVTILAHSADRERANDLAAALSTAPPFPRFRLREVDRDGAADVSASDAFIVVATRHLVTPELDAQVDALLNQRFAEDRTLIVTWHVETRNAAGASGNVIDLTEWNHDEDHYAVRAVSRRLDAMRRGGGGGGSQVTDAMLGRVDDLPLSARTKTLIRNDNIVFVGDLVNRSEAEMLRMPSFGRKSLDDVKRALRGVGLRLGMDPVGWPPDEIEVATLRLASARRVAQLRQVPGGATFEAERDRFVMRSVADEDDAAAARRPMTRQMQAAVLDKARAFGGLAGRLDNQPGWTGIARAAVTLADLLDRPADGIPDVLGRIYPTALELASFLELDQALSAGSQSFAAPLDPELRRPLADMVRTLAPWLRTFPSIRDADDAASRFLVEVAELKPTFEVVRSAEDHALLTEGDIEVFRQLRDAAERGAFQGGKAGGRVKRSATNLVIGIAVFASGLMIDAVVSDYATTSPLAHKAGQFLSRSEVAIEALVADMPFDLRHALVTFAREMADTPLLPARPAAPSRSEGMPGAGPRPPRRSS